MDEFNQSNLSASDKFGMVLPYSATHFLEVSGLLSLKVVTNLSN